MTFKAYDFEGIESKVTRVRICFDSFDNDRNAVITIGDYKPTKKTYRYTIPDYREHMLYLSDNIKWEQIGQSIGRSTVLSGFTFSFGFDDDIPLQWASIIEAFFNGLKHNTSLEKLEMDFSPRNGFPDFDLEYFVANNTQLKCLSISSFLPLLSDQGRMIASSIGTSSSLKQLFMSRGLEFEDADSFGQI
eukprot:scaffold99087_cov40-Cyclotella_meneghiniana.AAC.1